MDSRHGATKRKGGPVDEGDEAVAKVPRPSEADGPPAAQNGAPGLLVADRPPATVIHEVALPEGTVHQPKAPKPGSKPAKEYPFVLDPFQAKAIECLEAGESVLVSAHTSAGKTVVAEYAIAMALREKQRVVYTSPIKALSNQKYRELAEEFRDVGLMTGDVTIKPEASCLVMTTEILRSMFYKGSEVMREVAWIVMDEVHYLRDRERGVVWEESIVMAPKNARFVFLSATVPNAREFADWVAKVHCQPCHIVYTDFRPTPLQHYLFPAGGEGLYLVVDERSNFREDNFQTAINAVGAGADAKKEARKKAKGAEGAAPPAGPSDIFKIVKMVMTRQYDPVIVFSFSRQDCEALARQMMKLDLNDEDHRKAVEEVFWNAMDSLSEDDKKLPQVNAILPMLRRGIGIHHSGLLPILREVIEILFQEGLLKCLFATETFSIGLNMPAKTVVFTNVRKWDGDRFRWISSGEYIQMSGRAGRRGLDDRGIVILMLDEKMEPAVAKGMLQGSADSLDSAFHLSYNLLLSQMRCPDSTPEALLQRSYKQFQADRALPDLQARILEVEAEHAGVAVEGEAEVREYAELREQLRKLHRDHRKIVTAPQHVLPFLQPGRLIRVLCPPADEDKADPLADAAVVWGIVTNFEKVDTAKGDAGEGRPRLPQYTVDVLAPCVPDETAGLGRRKVMRPVEEGTPGAEPTVVALPLDQVDDLSSVRVYIAKDLRPLEARERAARAVAEVLRRFPDGVPTLDPEDDMQVDGSAYRKVMRKAETVEALLQGHALARSPSLRPRLQDLARKDALAAQLKAMRKQAKAAQSVVLKDELKARRRVLRRLGYATAEDVVEVKGRVAAEVSSADELVLTELIFSGAFQDLSVEQATALLSCFVWQEKVQNKGAAATRLKEELAGPLSALRDIAGRVGKVAEECKMEIDVDEYVAKFRPDIMELVAAWCRGAKFAEIMKMTEIFEGSLIRALRRIEELLRQLCAAAKSIGETELASKFQGGIERIKRDIVFAASLYL